MKSLVFLFLLAVPFIANAALPDSLFQSSDLLNISLSGPFNEINRERQRDKEYEGARLSYIDATGQEVVLDVSLEVRGNNRLRKENCRYSQLWVKFDRDQLKGTLFAGQRRLKLVVQCQASERYQSYLLKELQLYQLFNQVSDYSFATRLLQVNYQDNDSNNRSREHLAFFIEHDQRLAHRFDAEEVDLNSINTSDLNLPQATQVALFMYMIGNTDFSMSRASEGSCCHNTKLIFKDGKHFAIPYDFDSSGYVDTEYTVPSSSLPIRDNRQRLYRGYCTTPELLAATASRFNNLQQAFNTTVNASELISDREKRQALNYLEDFYEIVGNPRRFESQIASQCLGTILQ